MIRFLRPVLLSVAFALAACDSAGPSFKSTDITGAGFARDFSLVDHQGNPRTLADFQGKVLIVFFGFTQCPDVCPSTLLEMKSVMDALTPEEAAKVRVAFITVDPARDTQEVLAQYVPAFHPEFIGLRGDEKTVADVAREFKVFYMKVPGSSPDNYSVDHTAASYVFDKDGRVRLMLKHNSGVETIVHDLRQLL